MQSCSLVAVVLSAVALASLLNYSHATGIVATSSNCGPTDEVYCPVSRQCIPATWVCDSFPDCLHREDEQNCENECVEFLCEDSGCIPHHWQCDGEPDCNDESDERNCPDVPDYPLYADDYREDKK